MNKGVNYKHLFKTLYRPDGASIAIVPWSNGKMLVLDATFAPFFLAASAEDRKRSKYSFLEHSHIFIPVAIETSGECGSQLPVLWCVWFLW